jgi:hypothetical protein
LQDLGIATAEVTNWPHLIIIRDIANPHGITAVLYSILGEHNVDQSLLYRVIIVPSPCPNY